MGARSIEPILSDNERARIEAKIAAAERRTSAELKVIVDLKGNRDIRKRARSLFKKHGLYKTERRNAVLILMVAPRREFLIYGDRGIHERVGQDFWNDVRNAMLTQFQKNRLADGLALGVHLIGDRLAHHYPSGQGDINEVSNPVVFEI